MRPLCASERNYLQRKEHRQDTTKTNDERERLKKRAQRKLTTEDGTEQQVDINAVYFNAPYDDELVQAYTPSVRTINDQVLFKLQLGTLGPACPTLTEVQF